MTSLFIYRCPHNFLNNDNITIGKKEMLPYPVQQIRKLFEVEISLDECCSSKCMPEKIEVVFIFNAIELFAYKNW